MNEERLKSNVNNQVSKRGGWLTAFLIYLYIIFIIGAYGYFFHSTLIMKQLPQANEIIIISLGIGSLLNILFVSGIFMLKKWGVYWFYGATIFAYIINIYIGFNAQQLAVSLITPVLLFLLIRKKWSQFS